jgi:hypothetical protein
VIALAAAATAPVLTTVGAIYGAGSGGQ